jgi:hypothetical protein
MLIYVLNIKLTCEWHEAIKLSYIKLALMLFLSLGFPSAIDWQTLTYHCWLRILIHSQLLVSGDMTSHSGTSTDNMSTDSYNASTRKETTLFSGHYLHNHSTLDIGVLGYIGILYPKEHPPEVWHIPPGTLCIYRLLLYVINNRQHFKIYSGIPNINTRNNLDLHYPVSFVSLP